MAKEIWEMDYDSIRGMNPENNLRKKINELIELVNSQQEEIDELKSKQ